MREEALRLAAADGVALAATVVEPEEPPARAVLLAPATGTPRSFYLPFGRFLAGRGAAVLTWDWRGVGGSRPEGSLRRSEATMRDWGERDLQGMLRAARERWPDLPLSAVGHSFGGQGIGLAPDAIRLERIVLVAAQSGYWRHWGVLRGLPFALLWYVVVPSLTRLLGYFPSKAVGLGEDLPAGVALQWARWCRSPDYIGDWDGHARVTAPILALSFSDDPYATRASVEWLNGRYRSAPVRHRHLAPADVDADEVGHFGFFREGRVPQLWNDVAEFLES